MEQMITEFLSAVYGIDALAVSRMTTGVGGDTFRVDTAEEHLVFKIVKIDAINHPESEALLCTFLCGRGVPVSEFIPALDGSLVTQWPDGRAAHLQRLIAGQPFAMNTAPDWFLSASAQLLARIHTALADYPALPNGIGQGFFSHMTPESALRSYKTSLAAARERREEDVCEALSMRIHLADKHREWRIDHAPLTYMNTHGDFTVNQILCGDGYIRGVIDWTSACRHPVVWELTRSYFYAAPECASGACDPERFQAYVRSYEAICPLHKADRSMLLDVYLYQLLVCDYYAQYLHAAPHEADEFRQQADFATNVLMHYLT